MKTASFLIAVKDVRKSVAFYEQVLDQKIKEDFNRNVVFESGLSILEYKLWATFIKKDITDITFGSNNVELYFDEDNFDDFLVKLKTFKDIQYVHDVEIFPWGQRTIRFYDLDHHIIEVGESMDMVIYNYYREGHTIEEVHKHCEYSIDTIRKILQEKGCSI